MWVLLICDILRLKHVKKISAIIPYFGYGRQDIYDDGSQGAGCSVMRVLESAGISKLIAVELHAAVLQKAVSSMQIYNIQLTNFITEWISKEYEHQELTIVAPDKGSWERAAYIAHHLNVPLIRATKERVGADKTRLLSLSDTCKTPKALIVDDIIDTGSTVLHVVQGIRAGNDACKIDLFAVHPVLSNNAAQALQTSSIDRAWVTDSIELQSQQLFEKLRIIDISSLLVKVLRDLF
jgi:ribose-phosphate pyrophosphokinase